MALTRLKKPPLPLEKDKKDAKKEPGTKLFALGCGRCGCLATGSDADEFEPISIRLRKDTDVMLVASGTRHTIILSEENKVWCCGDNVEGQLGNDDDDEFEDPCDPRPLKISDYGIRRNIDPIMQVAAGYCSSYLRTASGRVFAWGGNKYGQLGLSDFKDRRTPTLITIPTGVRFSHIDAGHYFVVGMSTCGSVWSWGFGRYGALGCGSTTSAVMPTRITSLRRQSLKIYAVTAGGSHAAVMGSIRRWQDVEDKSINVLTGEIRQELAEISVVLTWGCNEKGQLGLRHSDPVYEPTMVPLLTGKKISKIACGDSHTLAYSDKQRKTYAWGEGLHGQLGLGNCYSYNYPQKVTMLDNCWLKVLQAGARNSACIIDGTPLTGLDGELGVFSWGSGSFGQNGHFSRSARIIPHVIKSDLYKHTDVTQLVVGYNRIFFVARPNVKARNAKRIARPEGSKPEKISPGHPKGLCSASETSARFGGSLQELYQVRVDKDIQSIVCAACAYHCHKGCHLKLLIIPSDSAPECQCKSIPTKLCLCRTGLPMLNAGKGQKGRRFRRPKNKKKKK